MNNKETQHADRMHQIKLDLRADPELSALDDELLKVGRQLKAMGLQAPGSQVRCEVLIDFLIPTDDPRRAKYEATVVATGMAGSPKARLECLIDFLLPADDPRRREYEVSAASTLLESCRTAIGQIRQMQLMQNVREGMPTGLTVPGQ